MDPLTIFYLIGLSVVGGVGAVMQYRRRNLRRASELLELPGSTRPHAETLNGFRVTHQREDMGERSVIGASRDTVPVYRNTTTIFEVLPAWVGFGWTVEPHAVRPDSRNTLWVHLIFGERPDLPDGGTVYASKGDLVYDTIIDDAPPGSDALVQAARRFVEALPDVVVALEDYVSRGAPSASVAFRILARSCPDAATAERLAVRHRGTSDEALWAEVAAFELPASRDRVVAKVNGDASVEARSVLIDALVERKDADGLAAIDPARVPAGSVEDYLETLRLAKHPKAEAAALYFFEQRVEIGAALQALTAIGGRASIGPLLAYQQSVTGAYELNLDLTIEMVRARIAAEVGGERGRLAIAEGDEAGGLSLAESGTLAVTDEE
ncbi:MAG: hypothetical protein RIT81_12690 [Deltaproteobacteria bacterium]